MLEKLNRLKEILTLLKKYGHAIGVISFDFETQVPKDGREEEGDVLDFLSNEYFKIFTSNEMKTLIPDLYNNKDQIEDPLDVKLIENLYES